MIYIGLTSNLIQSRHHKESMIESFTKKYDVKMLVCFEQHETAGSAISRKKQLKKWERAREKRLIEEESNPEWRDLYRTICI